MVYDGRKEIGEEYCFMWRDESEFINILSGDELLNNIYIFIANYSCEINSDKFAGKLFVEYPVEYNEVIKRIEKICEKGRPIIENYIQRLLSFGLIEFVTENKIDIINDNGTDENDQKRLETYKELGLPNETCKIKLTHFDEYMGCSGVGLYRRIILDKEEEEFSNSFGHSLESLIEPFENEIDQLSKNLEEKMSEVNKTVDSGVIKNIQVISVFAGIISLLFANIMGVKEFVQIGVRGVLILNLSTVMSILALLIFSKWIILDKEIKLSNIIGIVIVFALLIIPILIFFKN
jgi:hypothetical protein